jgi:hypothetical protein
MYSLKDILYYFTPCPGVAVNDNAGVSVPPEGFTGQAALAASDPYLAEACETKRLIEGARLISSVDGNAAAVLNLISTRQSKGRRAA